MQPPAPQLPRRRAAILEQTASALVPLRPLTIGEVLDASFLLLQRSPRRLLGLPLVVAVVFGLVGSALVAVWFWLGELQAEVAQVLMVVAAVGIIGLAVAGMVSWLMGVLCEEALRLVMGPGLASPVRPTLRQRVGLFWPMVTCVLLTGAFLVVAGFVAQIVQAGLLVVVAQLPGELAGTIGIVVLAALSIFLACWTFSFVSMMIPVYVAEGSLTSEWVGLPRRRTDLGQAFVRSFRLVAWRDSVRVGLALSGGVVVISTVAVIVTAGLLLLVQLYVMGLGMDVFQPNAVLSIAVVYAISWISVAIVSVAWLACLLTILYLDLRMRREGLDLALRFPVVDVPEPNDGRT